MYIYLYIKKKTGRRPAIESSRPGRRSPTRRANMYEDQQHRTTTQIVYIERERKEKRKKELGRRKGKGKGRKKPAKRKGKIEKKGEKKKKKGMGKEKLWKNERKGKTPKNPNRGRERRRERTISTYRELAYQKSGLRVRSRLGPGRWRRLGNMRGHKFSKKSKIKNK